MASVTVHSAFGAQENKVCHCFHCFPIYLSWSDGTGCHDLRFLNGEFEVGFFTLLFHHLASLSLAAKNIINLISVLTIWWCPCIQSSLVLLEEAVCYDQPILFTKLCFSLCPASFCGQVPVIPGISWLPSFAFQFPMMKSISFLVWVLEGLAGIHWSIQLQLLRP